MRHGTTNRRSRNRNNNRGKSGNNRAQVFDSNGPEVRIRGTAHQICEKYEALAKDALSVGDHVVAESYLQHAEHYQRMITTWNEQNQVKQQDQADDNNQASQPAKAAQDKQKSNDDLSLPASILGGELKVSSEGARAKQSALEDA